MAKKVVVVRVGEKITQIVHMENVANNPTVFGCVRVPTPEGSVSEGMIINEVEIAKRIEKACLEKGIHTKDVIFTVASAKIASRETVIPAVAKNKMDAVVMAKVADLFPVDVDKYIFTYKVQGSDYQDKDQGKVRNVRIFAAPSDLIESYYKLAEEAEMNVISVEGDGNSIFQIMSRQVKNSVTMCIQINRDSTLVNVVTSNEMLLQRVIPYGVSVFTDAMIQEPVFGVDDYEKAYKVLSSQRVLVHSMNAANPSGDFSTAKRIEITNNGEYLFSNIARVIEYYNSKYKDREIQNVICVGVGCSIAGIHELLSNELSVEVTTPTELEGVRFNKKIVIDAAILQYLNCFGSVFSPLNFVPKSMALRNARKGSLTGALAIFAGLVLVSLVLSGFSIIELMTASSNHDELQARKNALAPVEDQYNELTDVENQYNIMSNIKTYTNSNNNHFHELIDKLSEMVPKSFKIQSIQSDEDAVTMSASCNDRLSSLSLTQIQMNKVDNIKDVTIKEVAETEDENTGRRQYNYTLTFKYKNVNAITDTNASQGVQ
ncbi:MAG: pilus assembly protein PilM [Eubacterium sp.]